MLFLRVQDKASKYNTSFPIPLTIQIVEPLRVLKQLLFICIVTWSQFLQHFTCVFFVRKSFEQLLSASYGKWVCKMLMKLTHEGWNWRVSEKLPKKCDVFFELPETHNSITTTVSLSTPLSLTLTHTHTHTLSPTLPLSLSLCLIQLWSAFLHTQSLTPE